MGSTYFYLKARYKSPEALQEALPGIEGFLEDLGQVEKWLFEGENRSLTTSAMWNKLTQHSEVCLYLSEVAKLQPRIELTRELRQRLEDAVNLGEPEHWVTEDTFYLTSEVSHMADWNDLEAYFLKGLGAQEAEWISEEDSGSAAMWNMLLPDIDRKLLVAAVDETYGEKETRVYFFATSEEQAREALSDWWGIATTRDESDNDSVWSGDGESCATLAYVESMSVLDFLRKFRTVGGYKWLTTEAPENE